MGNYLRCPSFPSLIAVEEISFPMPTAMRVNSLLLASFPPDSSLCRCSDMRVGAAERERIDSTHALNSFVRSCIGITVCVFQPVLFGFWI